MPSFQRLLHTVDLHTGGEPLRLVLQGLPKVPGHTILSQRAWLRQHQDGPVSYTHLDVYKRQGLHRAPPVFRHT